MADPNEIFRKYRCKTPEWEANFEKPCFSLELEIFKEILSGGESTTAAETSEISKLDGNNVAEREVSVNSDSQELEDFISAQKSSNTVKKTKSDMRALKRFCFSIKRQENQKP